MATNPPPKPKPKRYKAIGKSSTNPVENKKRAEAVTKVPKTENIIFIGSEHHYDSFWLKMMFIAAAYLPATKSQNFRPATRKTIAYVDDGYTPLEKMTLDLLRDKLSFNVIKLSSSADIISCMSKDREEYKLQDVLFFSHGTNTSISLNYRGLPIMELNHANFTAVPKKAFAEHGRIFSYACRTGVSEGGGEFESEADAKPELSMAQKMADHFGIEVHAFLRRSHYGKVIRNVADSSSLSTLLKSAREGRESEVIELPPNHQALPHPGLARYTNPFGGQKKEGTAGFALWRKGGGIVLPSAGDTPKGLPAVMRVFRPAT